uniref:Uncharacterized protein n=1 Tax=Anguilla anguilla TaxID=7936 RepID=A0A0E9SQU8_ANGAN
MRTTTVTCFSSAFAVKSLYPGSPAVITVSLRAHMDATVHLDNSHEQPFLFVKGKTKWKQFPSRGIFFTSVYTIKSKCLFRACKLKCIMEV